MENIELSSQDFQITKPESGNESFEDDWAMSERDMPIQDNKTHEELLAQSRQQQQNHEIDPFGDLSSTNIALADEIKKLRDDLNSLKNIVTSTNPKILEGVSRLCENIDNFQSKPIFPVTSFEDLENLEEAIEVNFNHYVPIFKALLIPGGVSANLKRIIDEKLLFEMNLSGKSQKIGISKYKNLLNALFQAVQRDHYTFSEFQSDIRTAFSKIKNKIYKRKNPSDLNDSEKC